MVNHFLPIPPAPPAKPPDRDKLIENWLDSPSLEEKPSMQPRLCARNHIQPRPSTRYNKPYGLTRPSCLVLTLAVNLLVILTCASTAGAVRSEPDIANPNYPYLNSLATSETIGKLYLKLDTVSVDYVVPIYTLCIAHLCLSGAPEDNVNGHPFLSLAGVRFSTHLRKVLVAPTIPMEDQDSEEYCEVTALAVEMMRPSGCHDE